MVTTRFFRGEGIQIVRCGERLEGDGGILSAFEPRGQGGSGRRQHRHRPGLPLTVHPSG
jgi:hypothetical protein